jgi:ABC-type multidrug transport system ATPase subunit
MNVTLTNINKNYTTSSSFFIKKNVVRALKDFSMHFRGGNIYALTGKNGAGKTTLLKIMAGIVSQDSGNIQIDGRDASRGQVVYVSSNEAAFFEHLTVKQNIYFFSEIAGLTLEAIKARLELYSRMFCLEEHLPKKCWQLSSGTKRKIAIVLGLMRGSRILLIDEIFDKIDKGSRQVLTKHLREIVEKEGNIVVYTSHLSEHVPEFYDEIIEIDEGALVNVR